MPECLNNGEGLFPGHYDPLYDQAPNQYEPGHDSLEHFLQTKALDVLGVKLSPEKMEGLKGHLESKGILHRNIGDPSFDKAVRVHLKRLKMARKVSRIWQ